MIADIILRPWLVTDAAQIASIANNRKIWLNVRDRFPHPYTVKNSLEWIDFCRNQQPVQNMAIVYKGAVAGSIGIVPKEDVYRKNMEIGYFIGEAYWGLGIATRAVSLLLTHIETNFDVVRVYAEVFAHNTASMKVLEKNGFYQEAIRKKSVFKNNQLMDDHVWVKLF